MIAGVEGAFFVFVGLLVAALHTHSAELIRVRVPSQYAAGFGARRRRSPTGGAA
jgi:hypothetical protein